VQLERPITDSFEATDRATVADDEDLQMSRVRFAHHRPVWMTAACQQPLLGSRVQLPDENKLIC
jgi:hypothetical protein